MQRGLIIFILLSNFIFGQVDTCNFSKIYFPEGTVQFEGCIKNGKREGKWKEYSNYEKHHVRFIWTYHNDEKDGPYEVYGITGILEAKGTYKLGCLTDTLKYYNDKGEITQYDVWKITDLNSKASTFVTKKILIKPEHPDEYIETINGKKYRWYAGRKIEISSSNISTTDDSYWEEYDSTSQILKNKIKSSDLNGKWASTKREFKIGNERKTFNFKTPVIIEFKDSKIKGENSKVWNKFSIKDNIINRLYALDFKF